MKFIIAAAVAVVAALAEFTVVPYLRIGDATLHPVLVLGVVWAIAGGLEAGLVFAFVGGLRSTSSASGRSAHPPSAVLIAIGIRGAPRRLLSRVRIVAPVVATIRAGLLYSMLLLVATTALTNAPLAGCGRDAVVPSAIYDTVLATLVGPLTVAIVLRRREAERMDW